MSARERGGYGDDDDDDDDSRSSISRERDDGLGGGSSGRDDDDDDRGRPDYGVGGGLPGGNLGGGSDDDDSDSSSGSSGADDDRSSSRDDDDDDDFRRDQQASQRVGGSGDPDDEPADPDTSLTGGNDRRRDQDASQRVGGSGDPTDPTEASQADGGSGRGGSAVVGGRSDSPVVEDQATAALNRRTETTLRTNDVDVDLEEGVASLTPAARLRERRRREEEVARQIGEAEREAPSDTAETVGSVLGAVAASPVGTAADRVGDALFEGNDAVLRRLDEELEGPADTFEATFTDPLEGPAPEPTPGPTTAVDAANSPLVRDSAAQATQFLNVPALGRDLIAAGSATRSIAAELEQREGEAVQDLFDAAAATPDVAREAAETAAENPQETARAAAVTGGALVATAGVGGLARTGARSAARGTTSAARRLGASADDTLDLSTSVTRARRRAAAARDRTPDVSVRRDADAPRLEVDPLLRQQLRDVADTSPSEAVGGAVRRATPDVRDRTPSRGDIASAVRDRTPSAPGLPTDRARGLAESVGDAVSDADTRLRLEAEALRANRAADATDDATEPLGRRVGRRLETARIRGRLRARSELAATQERLDELSLPSPSRPSVSSEPVRRRLERLADRDLSGVTPTLSTSGPAISTPSARELGRRFERRRVETRLAAQSSLASTSERVRNAADVTLSRPSTGISERLDDAVGFAREGTVRVGPFRPRQSRTTLDADELELDPDPLPDDAVPGATSSGFEAFDDFASTSSSGRGGTAQLTGLRRRRDSDDLFDESEVTRRDRRRGGPDTGLESGFAAASAFLSAFDTDEPLGVNDAADDALGYDPTAELDFGGSLAFDDDTATGLEEPTTTTGVTSGVGTGQASGTSFDFGVATPTATTTSLTPTQTTTTTFSSPPPTGDTPTGRDFPDLEPDRDSDFDFGGFDIDDRVFGTGVADPDDVLDDALGGFGR